MSDDQELFFIHARKDLAQLVVKPLSFKALTSENFTSLKSDDVTHDDATPVTTLFHLTIDLAIFTMISPPPFTKTKYVIEHFFHEPLI